MTEHTQANLSLDREEIELIQLAMECLYSELPEYESVMKKLGAMLDAKETRHEQN